MQLCNFDTAVPSFREDFNTNECTADGRKHDDRFCL